MKDYKRRIEMTGQKGIRKSKAPDELGMIPGSHQYADQIARIEGRKPEKRGN